MRINDDGTINFDDMTGFDFDIADLGVDENLLHEQACEAPIQIAKLGMMLGKATITQRNARLTRDHVHANVAEAMRADNPKIAMNAIEAALPANPEYQEASNRLTQAEGSIVALDALLKAAVQRRAIIDTVYNINRSASNND